MPSLRNFTGRENDLPIDAHGWYALIAPRACLIHTAHNDGSEPTFAVEKGYIEGRSVYRLLGAEQNLRIDYRPGGHSSGPPPSSRSCGSSAKSRLDDLSLGRGLAKRSDFPEELIHDFDWHAWANQKPGDKQSIRAPVVSASSGRLAKRRRDWPSQSNRSS